MCNPSVVATPETQRPQASSDGGRRISLFNKNRNVQNNMKAKNSSNNSVVTQRTCSVRSQGSISTSSYRSDNSDCYSRLRDTRSKRLEAIQRAGRSMAFQHHVNKQIESSSTATNASTNASTRPEQRPSAILRDFPELPPDDVTANSSPSSSLDFNIDNIDCDDQTEVSSLCNEDEEVAKLKAQVCMLKKKQSKTEEQLLAQLSKKTEPSNWRERFETAWHNHRGQRKSQRAEQARGSQEKEIQVHGSPVRILVPGMRRTSWTSRVEGFLRNRGESRELDDGIRRLEEENLKLKMELMQLQMKQDEEMLMIETAKMKRDLNALTPPKQQKVDTN